VQLTLLIKGRFTHRKTEPPDLYASINPGVSVFQCGNWWKILHKCYKYNNKCLQKWVRVLKLVLRNENIYPENAFLWDSIKGGHMKKTITHYLFNGDRN